MHDLAPLAPLGFDTPQVVSHGDTTLTELPDVALASVAARLGREDATRSGLHTVIGAPAPGPGRFVQGPDLGAFWIGPDQWMIEASYATHELLADTLASAFGGTASVTEQSDGWCRFDMTGPRLFDVFELLCPVDLRPAEPGLATRTTIDHLGCLLVMRETTQISVMGPRSAAHSLWHALETAMRAAA